MGMLRSESNLSWLRRRGVAVLAIGAVHVLALAAMVHMGVIRPDPEPQVIAIKVVSLAREPQQQPQRPEQPQLERPRIAPVVVPMPHVEIPLDDVTPPTAIRVVAAAAPPSPPVAQQASLDAPVPVDTVEYLRQVPPRYPPQAKRARAQGVVYLSVIIDHDGRPREVRVHRSSGSQLLDAAARDAVLQFLFRPYRENGVARSAQVIVPVEFSLKSRHS
jgi:periplasmic protein TonB